MDIILGIRDILNLIQPNFNDPLTWGAIGYGINKVYHKEIMAAVKFLFEPLKDTIKNSYYPYPSYLATKQNMAYRNKNIEDMIA